MANVRVSQLQSSAPKTSNTINVIYVMQHDIIHFVCNLTKPYIEMLATAEKNHSLLGC